VSDEHGCVAVGGHADELTDSMRQRYADSWDLATAVRTSVEVLGSPESRTVDPATVEAGVLDRARDARRKFRRLSPDEVSGLLA
jgi:proteasome alpha subunit